MSSEVSLDLLLFECTKQTSSALDADAVSKFCTAVEKDLDGPSTAARLLGHKIQSPQEQESLNALCVADECVKRCGRRFQDELGKFRFLNEIIKMISPKLLSYLIANVSLSRYLVQYFGDRTSKKVKDKCIELLYRWSVELRHEPKISDAYEMLKRQGIIDDDPIIGETHTNGELGAISQAEEALPQDTTTEDTTTHDQKDSIFSDEEKSKLLARLLRSKHPDDLQAANRLIKNMVKQDEEKQEKISQRYQLLETVKNNVKLLNEMLDCYQMAGGSSHSDKDIIRELHQNIEAERPKLFKLASDTEDKDSDGMSQILQVNDDVVQISTRYKQVVEQGASGEGKDAGSKKSAKPALEEDLAGLDLGGGASAPSDDIFGGFATTSSAAPPTSANGILDLFSNTTTSSLSATGSSITTNPMIGSTIPAPNTQPSSSGVTAAAAAPASTDLADLFSSVSTPSTSQNTATGTSSFTPNTIQSASNSDDIGLLSLDSMPASSAGLSAPLLPDSNTPSLFDMPTADSSDNLFDTKKNALEDLDFLGQDLLQKTKPAQPVQPIPPAAPVVRPSLNQLKASNVEGNLSQPVQAPTATPAPPVSAATAVPVLPLTNVFVPIDTVKPGTLPPLTVYDAEEVKIILHFAQNKPREDVSVMVISIMSNKTSPIKAVMFQAAVPKSMKVKLQPPSGTELPGFNPILPPSAITQVMTLANPSKEKVKLKYKLTYNLNGSPVAKTGDVLNFPL